MELLRKMCEIHSPSGEEKAMKEFLLDYIKINQNIWKVKPTLHFGDGFQDNLILVFGNKPRTAIFSHLDSIGFTVKYNNEIVKIGCPVTTEEIILVGEDSKGKIYFIDFNPRFGGGYPITHLSGFNYLSALLNMSIGNKIYFKT